MVFVARERTETNGVEPASGSTETSSGVVRGTNGEQAGVTGGFTGVVGAGAVGSGGGCSITGTSAGGSCGDVEAELHAAKAQAKRANGKTKRRCVMRLTRCH